MPGERACLRGQLYPLFSLPNFSEKPPKRGSSKTTAGIQEKDGEAARTLCSIAGAAANHGWILPAKMKTTWPGKLGTSPQSLSPDAALVARCPCTWCCWGTEQRCKQGGKNLLAAISPYPFIPKPISKGFLRNAMPLPTRVHHFGSWIFIPLHPAPCPRSGQLIL